MYRTNVNYLKKLTKKNSKNAKKMKHLSNLIFQKRSLNMTNYTLLEKGIMIGKSSQKLKNIMYYHRSKKIVLSFDSVPVILNLISSLNTPSNHNCT